MDHRTIIFKILITLSVSLIFVLPSYSMDDPEFSISRMVMCERVADREPIGIADTFTADVETVFCFLETQNINVDTTISLVWYFEGQEKARITLPLQKGPRWRTYSNKKLAHMKGNWTVELQENSGIVLSTVSFRVQ